MSESTVEQSSPSQGTSDNGSNVVEGALSDVSVVVTRSEEQAGELRALLQEAGATVYLYPCIESAPVRDATALDEALRQAVAGTFDWLLLTSTNTVRALQSRMAALEIDSALFENVQLAAVGPATASAVEETWRMRVDFVPDGQTAAALAETLPLERMEGAVRVLLPQSTLANDLLEISLRERGAEVTRVDAYRTVLAEGGDSVPDLLYEGKIDIVTFTSGSTVRGFRKRLQAVRGTLDMLDHVVVACIGPSTAATARQYGLTVHVLPAEHTAQGLVKALAAYFEANRQTKTSS